MDKSLTPVSRRSKSSSPNSLSESSSSNESNLRRPRRSASINVDYNLKKRRIIPGDDYLVKKKDPKQEIGGAEASEIVKEQKDVLEHTPNGEIHFNEPRITDPVNGMTGLPLSMGPPEKVKKESLWNYRKNQNGSTTTAREIDMEESAEKSYQQNLLTEESDHLTSMSELRREHEPVDIHKEKRRGRKIKATKHKHKHFPMHTKIKATAAKENKLFGQNSITNQKTIATPLIAEDVVIENDDYCASCFQPGVFLCCDTCPKSFHFACCNPPLDPDNLPEGDWSCEDCQLRIQCSTKASVHKLEKEFLGELERTKGISLFGKLLFRVEHANPKQFQLPLSIREAFLDVKTGSHGEYLDNSLKEPLNEKQLLGTPYGQSLTRMDQYNPELHMDQESGKILVCYKCRQSKMGTIDHPESERLIMSCDYCGTPWHLDCIPRASFKNLGSKWACPLHANSLIPFRKRRLARNQKTLSPSIPCGYANNGDIDVILDEVSAPISKEVLKENKKNNELAVVHLSENSIKLDFVDKIYRAKKALREQNLRDQDHLIDKILSSCSQSYPQLNDVSSLLYFSLQSSQHLKKLWDFKELCKVATAEAEKVDLDSVEIRKLSALKKLLESKSRREVMDFFGLHE